MSSKLMLFVVVNDNTKMLDVMAGLAEAGVTGATLIETQGMARILSKEIPIFAGLRNISAGSKPFNFTIFSVIENSEIIKDIRLILEDILEDEESNGSKGILFTLPVSDFYHL